MGSLLNQYDLSSGLFGVSPRDVVYKPTALATDSKSLESAPTFGIAMSDSSSGTVWVVLGEGSNGAAAVLVPTTVDVKAGDKVMLALTGMHMQVIGVVGGGDRTQAIVDATSHAAVAAANDAAQALAEASQAQTIAANAAADILAASQAAESAKNQAEFAARQAEDAKVESSNAKQAADDAKIDALLAKATADDASELATAVGTNVDNLSTSVNASLAQTATQILLSVEAEYSRQTDLADYAASVAAQLAVMDQEITLRFDQTATATSTVADNLAADQAERESYYQFTADAMVIGRSESPSQVVIDNTHIGFLYQGNEIAGISNNRMYNTILEVRSSLSIGVAPNIYDFIVKQNGNLTLKFRSA